MCALTRFPYNPLTTARFLQFPQPRAVPASRLAVMRMMATCRPEAFAHCRVVPGQPVCPMRLAQCLHQGLQSHPDEVSPMCAAAVRNMEQFMKKKPAAPEEHQAHARLAQAEAQATPEVEVVHPQTTEPAAPKKHHHKGLHCYMHKLWHFLTHEGSFFGAMLAGIVASALFWVVLVVIVSCIKVCCCRRARQSRYVVIETSEPPPLGYITKVEETSELQV